MYYIIVFIIGCILGSYGMVSVHAQDLPVSSKVVAPQYRVFNFSDDTTQIKISQLKQITNQNRSILYEISK